MAFPLKRWFSPSAAWTQRWHEKQEIYPLSVCGFRLNPKWLLNEQNVHNVGRRCNYFTSSECTYMCSTEQFWVCQICLVASEGNTTLLKISVRVELTEGRLILFQLTSPPELLLCLCHYICEMLNNHKTHNSSDCERIVVLQMNTVILPLLCPT